KCLSKEPSQRYASAEALADDLGRWLRGEALAEDTALRTDRFWKRRKLVFAVLGMLVLAGLAFTAAHLPRGAKPPAPPEAAGPSPPPSLVLLGATEPLPQQARWLRGGDKIEDVTKPGEPVSLRAEDSAEDFALLELLSEPPWPRYRLEVEMHRDNKPAKGD